MELKNIINLVKIQFKQKLQLLWFSIIILGIFSISILVDFYKSLENSTSGFIVNLNKDLAFVSMLFIPFICLLCSNIISNSEIKMYPGNIKTRYFSRLITDHIYIVCSYFVILAINILTNLIVALAKLFGKPLNLTTLFDVKYWLIGFLIYTSVGFMVYMFFALFNTIFSRIHYFFTISIALIIFMLFKNDVFNFDEFRYTISSFYFSQNMGFTTFIIRALSTWVVLLLLGYLLTFTIKKWGPELSQFKVFIIWIIEFIMFTIAVASVYFEKADAFISHNEYEENHTQKKVKDFYADIPDDFSPIELEYFFDIENSIYSTSVTTIEYDRALELNVINSEIEIPKGQMYVHIYCPNISINGKEIDEAIVDSLELDFVNKTVSYPDKDEIYVVNNFLGNLYKFEKNYSEGSDYTSYEDDFYISIFIIYND